MHSRRHRSPSNGVKLNSAGIRLPPPQMSPERSVRVRREYISDHRSFNKRRFRRGPGKHYPPLPQLPPRGDIFMEAGRLAAEYLVSQGLLPPNLLSGRQQNGNLKGPKGDLHGFRLQDRDSPLPPPEGRTSALARLGNTIPDTGHCRRRSLDEFNPERSRSHERGRRSNENHRGYGLDHWSREKRRNGSFSERARAFSDVEEGEDEFYGGRHEDRRADLDVVIGRAPKTSTDEPSLKKEISGNFESKLDNFELPDDVGFEAISSKAKRDPPIETQMILNKGLDDAKISSSVNEVKDGNVCDEEMEKEKAPEELGKQHVSVEDVDMPNNHGSSDLPDLCRSGEVSTETQSPLATCVLKVDQGPSIRENEMCDLSVAGGPKLSREKDSAEGASSNLFTNLTHNSESLASDISRFSSLHSVGEAHDLDTAIVEGSEICPRSQSFSDRSSFINEQGSSQPLGFERCRSMDELNESFGQNPASWGATKRPRERTPPMVSDPDDLICLRDLRAKHIRMQAANISAGEEIVKAIDEEKLDEGDLSSKGKIDSGLAAREEKQHFPSFFKIRDLNLADVSEITESSEGLVGDHISAGPSTLGVEKQASADIGLSIFNSNFNSSHIHDERSINAIQVAGIDATNGSVMEDKVFVTSERKAEPIFSSADSFLNQTQNADDLPEVRDGYGLGISEFLGTDISNCSSGLPSDVNDMQTAMALHNQEGIPSEDDQIFLSLGEIPISFMGDWDQPNHDFGKPF
eukprot:TRINITY_DN2460_c0_g1_i1.p1 TRINITY_DN2460_c0_g1~~TRINITY_DN2460_c0_g1_i1.p1  ORF type:complete len:748 (-),score=199.33 TRINITY_DN2460_c0_g1_i1:372-2615(-)